MVKKKQYKSLFICGCCGKDTEGTKGVTKKVILSGHANMLCWSCRCEFEDSIDDIARKYLSEP